jgi:hypothetical protein
MRILTEYFIQTTLPDLPSTISGFSPPTPAAANGGGKSSRIDANYLLSGELKIAIAIAIAAAAAVTLIPISTPRLM